MTTLCLLLPLSAASAAEGDFSERISHMAEITGIRDSFDGDKAGRNAARKALEAAMEKEAVETEREQQRENADYLNRRVNFAEFLQ